MREIVCCDCKKTTEASNNAQKRCSACRKRKDDEKRAYRNRTPEQREQAKAKARERARLHPRTPEQQQHAAALARERYQAQAAVVDAALPRGPRKSSERQLAWARARAARRTPEEMEQKRDRDRRSARERNGLRRARLAEARRILAERDAAIAEFLSGLDSG